MMLRLQIEAAGRKTTFEHPRPVVHIGRDPACELALEGEASTGVSRRHTRIELSAGGATVADAGSSNGTLHNDRELDAPAPLRVGDRIQLGYTGPTLTVLALDLAAPAKAAPAAAPSRLALLGGGAAAAVLLAVGLWWLLSGVLSRGKAADGSLLLEVDPPGAEVFVDGERVPDSPPGSGKPLRLDRPAGTYELKVVRGGFVTQTRQVTLTAGEEQSLRFRLVPEKVAAARPPEPDGTSPKGDEQASAGQATTARPADSGPGQRGEPAKPAPAVGAVEIAEVPVGRYVSLPEWGPSVLLSRRGEAYPWTPLRPDARVLTAQSLLSLPGYRSEVLTDSKVQLTLWGNLPPFCGVPPLLLESAAMLNPPADGIDLDLSLEWGRVRLANRKEKGAAQVRLRFLRETWNLTLPGPGSEVCVELWSLLPPAGARAGDEQLPVSLGLFTRGPASLERSGPRPERLDLPDRTRVAWVNAAGAPLFRDTMRELPGWWTRPPDANDDRVAEVMLALKDWAERLAGAGELVETIQKAVAGSDDPALREQAMYFLAALDGAPYLVNHLEDPRHARARRAAAHALRGWLSRGDGRPAELTRLLQVRANAPPTAALVYRLLHPHAEEELARPDTYQQLLAHLDHDSLAVRELASWHLEDLAPEAAEGLAYNAAEDRERRRTTVAQWQKALPPGSVPRRPPQ